ncbi:type 1 glutamine amidotransferase [Brevundimonas sp.]|uniref:glutamine amidotransferase-related protein n=1 Tax=Brevundimonas sp. TaxID=1871086 RepID=UPI0025DD9B51|nr:type 1 glutamine amidotransferase [Brevundimonas sp.]
MNIAILKTGRPPAALEPRFGGYPEMMRTMLGDGVVATTFDVQAGELPDPTRFEAALLTGSASGVYDGDPWIAGLLHWLRDARGRTRLVGVCFGHQAMAQAFGGRVVKSDKGWGIGLQDYRVVGDEPWIKPPARSVAIPASHQDQVVDQPPGSRVWLASDFTPFAGLAYGTDAISLQPHPEFEPAYAAALVDGRRGDRFENDFADRAIVSLGRPNDRALLGKWIGRFIAR